MAACTSRWYNRKKTLCVYRSAAQFKSCTLHSLFVPDPLSCLSWRMMGQHSSWMLAAGSLWVCNRGTVWHHRNSLNLWQAHGTFPARHQLPNTKDVWVIPGECGLSWTALLHLLKVAPYVQRCVNYLWCKMAMIPCVWSRITVEKWWQREIGGCKGADEQGAASREMTCSAHITNLTSNDCRAKERSGCTCHGHVCAWD